MAAEENTNWSQSVTGIVIRDNKVLLARHTYGPGKGKLIVPGGYVKWQESPRGPGKESLWRDRWRWNPWTFIGIRFNQKDWYVAFRAEYKGGRAVSDGDENSEVLWLDVEEALSREDVPDLTKKLIQSALSGKSMKHIGYKGTTRYGEYSFYSFE